MLKPSSEGPSPDVDSQVHPIAEAIDELVHRARDVKGAAIQFRPAALKAKHEALQKFRDRLEAQVPLLNGGSPQESVLAERTVYDTMFLVDRAIRSDIGHAVETGLFLTLFSAFDAFTGKLLKSIYLRRPELFNSLNGTVSVGEVLAASSIDELKARILDEDIETLRRKSYRDQFTVLAQRFGIQLNKFDGWPAFVECSQRRNLLTHCDGIVSQQYLGVCAEEGFEPGKLPQLGSRVGLGEPYFSETCELVIEVGIKLGHTLWRKALPSELDESTKELKDALFAALVSRNWKRARMIGEFAMSLPKLAPEVSKRMIVVNFAQALKRDGDAKRASLLMGGYDWTACGDSFLLADAVLSGDYPLAGQIMRKIGPHDTMVSEVTYYSWPLFLEFRESPEFAAAYQDIFGYAYASKLRQEAENAYSAVEKQTGDEDDSGQPAPAVQEPNTASGS